MAKERDIEKIITLTGEKDEDLIELLLDDAEEFVKSYTGRKNIVRNSKDYGIKRYKQCGKRLQRHH